MKKVEALPGFPLGQWVDLHRTVRHNLALSGMAGSLRTVPRVLRHPATADPLELRRELARIHGVEPRDLFLTHGGHEANFLALSFLAGQRRRTGRRLRIRLDLPEYPPLLDMARGVGGQVFHGEGARDVWVLSNPNNPTGRCLSHREISERQGSATSVIIDEAFREFTDAPSVAAPGADGFWATGTFTKTYGADSIRVGWLIPPRESVAGYERFHPVAADKIGVHSVDSAMAILRTRTKILREVRGIFAQNKKALAQAIPDSSPPAGPIWFDRGNRGVPGDLLQASALRRSILVCSGRFFGDPRGVRICLTRRNFPEDISRYVRVRKDFLCPS